MAFRDVKCRHVGKQLTLLWDIDVPADDGSTAGFLFRGVALGCGDGEVLTTMGGSPSQRIAMPFERERENYWLRGLLLISFRLQEEHRSLMDARK
jgi:hypothetical protein